MLKKATPKTVNTVAKAAPKPEVKPEPRIERETFAHRAHRLKDEVLANDKAIERLKSQIAALDALNSEAKCEIQLLAKIKSMAKLKDAPYEWHMIKHSSSEYNHTAWSEDYTYKTAQYEFRIVLSEVTNAPKNKFMTEVGGKKTDMTPESFFGDTDYTYVNAKYMDSRVNDFGKAIEWHVSKDKGGLELNKSFSSEKDARNFVSQWQGRLVDDHMAIIEPEKELFKQCK